MLTTRLPQAPSLRRAALALCALCAFALPATAATDYTYTQLLPLGGQAGSTASNGINNLGQVVGYSSTDQGALPTVWNASAMPVQLAGLNSGYSGVANAINDVQQAVGRVGSQGILWTGTQPTELPPVYAHTYADPYAINNAGEAVGISGGIAMLWKNG